MHLATLSLHRWGIAFAIWPRINISSLLGVLTLLLLSCSSPAASGENSRHILLLYGAEKDLPMNLILDSQLRAAFREKLNDGVELYSEYVDVSRFPEKVYPRKLLELLHDKYSARGLDLIVVVEASALDLVQLHRDWFFPATPVVFCCVREAEYKARTIRPGVTGIPAKLDYGPTLEVALRLHPGTRRVVVIAGASKGDTEDASDARRAFRPFESKVEFSYLLGLPIADLRQEVSRLSQDTIIIYFSISQDGAGKFFIPRDALDQVAQAANVPVYGYYDSYLGHGIVGGFLASFEIEATNAARLGLRILGGEKPEDLSTAETTSCAYMFDWRELKRWSINEEGLPPGSVVHFRDPRFWDLYRWQVIGVVSLCAVQAVLILGLLLQRARGRRAEKDRKRAEERFQFAVEAAPVAIILLDRQGRITLVNPQVERLFGYKREELLGQVVEVLIPERFRQQHPDHRERFFSEPRAREMGAGRDLFGLRKDGTEFPVEVGLSPIPTDAGLSVQVTIIDVTERKRAEDQLRAGHERQRDLVSRLLRAQEVERRRLAREMHDDLTQRVAVMAIEIGKLEAQLNLPGPVAESLRNTRDQLVKLSEDVHALSRQLHPSILDDLGLADALRSECVHFQQRERITVNYQTDNVPVDLPRDTALCLYRIAQEALRNVARHAGTSSVEVSLFGQDGEVLLTVIDRGKGFDVNGRSSHARLGLASMEERARLIGAELSIQSHPGRGTTLSVLVPRHGRES